MATTSENRCFDIPLANPSEKRTHLRVQLTYLRSQGVILEAFPIAVTESLVTIPFWSDSRGQLKLEDMGRLNRRHLDVLLEKVRAEIHAQAGRYWDHVKAILETNEMRLASGEGGTSPRSAEGSISQSEVAEGL